MNRRQLFTSTSRAALATALGGLWPFQGAEAQQIRGTPGSPSAVEFPDSRFLPTPSPPFAGHIMPNAIDSTPAWPPRTMPPEGAPKVLLILLDDAGYASNSAFGGVIPTPTLDRLAQHGLRYTMFDTTSLCSPTRAALPTGRNHHAAGFGVVSEMSTGYDGYNAMTTPENAHGAKTLQLNGYATAWFDKNHNIPPAEASPTGPFTRWPVNMGYDYFYGFAGGDTSQWQPGNLYRNTTPIFPFNYQPGWNLISAMADDAIGWIRIQHEVSPGRPWFIHYAPGATHAPHHPTPEWIERIERMNLFNDGWEKLREQIFENQKWIGVIPANAELTPWPDALQRWDSRLADEKRLFLRQVNVYAAYMAYVDAEIGCVVAEIERFGQLDNTLIIFVTGDNGASAEGQLNGTPNESSFFNGVDVPVSFQLPSIPVWGSDQTYPHFAVGWSWALDTPFRWVKQIAPHFGGMRNGMVIHWPQRIKNGGGIRTQFHHVIDVIPTILDAAGIPQATAINGITQNPFDGVSMVYTFDDANAPSRRETQYFEMIGNRGIYNAGWFANTIPVAPPWNGMAPRPTDVLNGFQWELFNLADDPTQFRSVADQHPDRLRMMQALFLAEAAKYQVLPLDASALDRFVVPRPGPAAGRQQFVYTGPLHSLQDACAPKLQNRAYRITAEIEVPSGGASGMLVTHGGRFGGYGLYLVQGKPTFTYNFLNLARAKWQGPELSPGRHTITFDFQPATGVVVQLPFGRGGTGTLVVDGQQVATRSMPRTVPIILTLDETFDVGLDTGTPVDDSDYQVPFPFTGKLDKLTIDLGATTMTPEALKELNKLLAARQLPVVGGLIGDFEDFLQRMKQGKGP